MHDAIRVRSRRRVHQSDHSTASVVQRINEALDVSITISKGDTWRIVSGNSRDMVQHQHVLVADVAIGRERASHVHVTLVGEGFHEVEPATPDVAEMYVEQLAAFAEPADHIEDLATG